MISLIERETKREGKKKVIPSPLLIQSWNINNANSINRSDSVTSNY